MKPFDSYVICTSPRSGSTLLCKLLREAGNAGYPESHFHEPSLDSWLSYFELRREDFSTKQTTLKAIFNSAYKEGKGASEVFGMRLQRDSFDFFIAQLSVLFPLIPDEKSRIHAAFGKTLFIHLTRENKLDQAISYVKAQQSGLWHIAPDGTELERLSEPQEHFYDATAIASQLALSKQMETEWEKWFLAEQIKPMRVTYRELSAAPYRTLTSILNALGLECEPKDEIAPPVAKLADATNQEWAERFQSEAWP